MATIYIYVEFDKQTLVWHVQDRKKQIPIRTLNSMMVNASPVLVNQALGFFTTFTLLKQANVW